MGSSFTAKRKTPSNREKVGRRGEKHARIPKLTIRTDRRKALNG